MIQNNKKDVNSKLKSFEEKEIKIKELTEKEFNKINEDISKALNKNNIESKESLDEDENEKDFDKYDIDFFSSNNSSSISNDGAHDKNENPYKIGNTETNLENNCTCKNIVINNKKEYPIIKSNNIGNIKNNSNESIIFSNNFSYSTKGDSNSSNEKFNFFEKIRTINDSFISNENKSKLNVNTQKSNNSIINFNLPSDNCSNNYLFLNNNNLSNNINKNCNQYSNNQNINININDNINLYNNLNSERMKRFKAFNNINTFVNSNSINNVYYNNFIKDGLLNTFNNHKINKVNFINNPYQNGNLMWPNNNIIKNTIDSPKNIIHIENILKGKDKRTTLIVRNIPNRYSINSILQDLNQSFKHKFNVLYLPQDINNNSNLGYGFIDFIDHMHIPLFYEMFNGKNWLKHNSFKICQLAYSKYQGKGELIKYIHKKLGVFNHSNNNDNLEKSFFINENDKFCKPFIEIPIRFYNCFKRFYPYSICKFKNNEIFIVEKYYNL